MLTTSCMQGNILEFSHYCSSPRIHWPVPFSHIYIIAHLSEPHRTLTEKPSPSYFWTCKYVHKPKISWQQQQPFLEHCNVQFSKLLCPALLGSVSLISMDCMTQAPSLWFPVQLGPWEPLQIRGRRREGGISFLFPSCLSVRLCCGCLIPGHIFPPQSELSPGSGNDW